MSNIAYLRRTHDRLPQELKDILQHTNRCDFDPILHYKIKTKAQLLEWLKFNDHADYLRCIESIEINDKVKRSNKN